MKENHFGKRSLGVWKGRRKAFSAAVTGHVYIEIIYSHGIIIENIFLKVFIFKSLKILCYLF